MATSTLAPWHYSKLPVHPGLMRRTVALEAVHELQGFSRYDDIFDESDQGLEHPAEVEAWAEGLPVGHMYVWVPAADADEAVYSGFYVTNEFNSSEELEEIDSEDGDPTVEDVHIPSTKLGEFVAGLKWTWQLKFGTRESRAQDSAAVETFKNQDFDAAMLTLLEQVSARVDEGIAWLERILSSPDAHTASGVSVRELYARCFARQLSDASSIFTFGDFASVTALDALIDDDRRARLDELTRAVLQLPEFDWLDAEGERVYFDPDHSWSPSTYRGGFPRRIENWEWPVDTRITVPHTQYFDGARSEWFALRPDDYAFSVRDPEIREHYDEGEERWRNVRMTREVFGEDNTDFADPEIAGRITLASAILPDGHYYELTTPESVKWLIETYPLILADPERSSVSHLGGVAGPPSFTADWTALVKDFDGVRLPVRGFLEVGYVPVRVETSEGDGVAMVVGWVPGSTIAFK